MQPARIIYNTSAVPAWCRRRRSCRSGASSCGAGSRWSACTPSSQPVILTRCLPTTRTLHLTPREHRHVLRLHLPVSCLIFDLLLPRQSGQPPQWHLPCLSRVRKHFTHPLSHPHLCSSSPSSDRAFSSASAPCSPVAIRAQRTSYICNATLFHHEPLSLARPHDPQHQAGDVEQQQHSDQKTDNPVKQFAV